MTEERRSPAGIPIEETYTPPQVDIGSAERETPNEPWGGAYEQHPADREA